MGEDRGVLREVDAIHWAVGQTKPALWVSALGHINTLDGLHPLGCLPLKYYGPGGAEAVAE